jgi:hypothetical protein
MRDDLQPFGSPSKNRRPELPGLDVPQIPGRRSPPNLPPFAARGEHAGNGRFPTENPIVKAKIRP